MTFKKGQSGNPSGKPVGTINKTTRLARESISAFIDGNADRLQGWLDQIAEVEGPKEAFKAFSDMLEYHVPKLSRMEGHMTEGPKKSHEEWLDELK